MNLKEERRIRSLIKEMILLEGQRIFKRSSVQEIEDKWPQFFDYLRAKFSPVLKDAIVSVEKSGFFGKGIPHVIVPGQDTVYLWDNDLNRLGYSTSTTTKSAILDSHGR
jgi:hypothetical protein